ncbi:hypothetical protein QNH14_08730 [Apirhabdus apintestini]|nr:hypothetical protein QNH14_08730 [Enterobacteriaceae bacterium CA-0114]
MGWSAFYHYTLFIQADSARAAALTKAQMQEKTIHELLHRQQVLSGQEQQQARELADARATIRRLQTEYDNSHSMAEHSAL